MTKVKFFFSNSLIEFEISGHSTADCDDLDGKIVCSAVSSAALMAANTVTEIIGDQIEATVDEGYMRVVLSNPSKASSDVIKGLRLHLTELSEQYNTRIKITTEV